MLIGIMSDSHENMPKIREAVRLFNERGVEVVFHCGDIISPITYKEMKDLKAKLYMVFGNNDGERKFLKEKYKDATIFDDVGEVSISGKKIVFSHYPEVIDNYKDKDVDIILYGHTHKIDIREGKPYIINPGEVGGWLYGRSTVVIFDINTMTHELIDI